MITFHAVTLDDKTTIESYTLRSECRNCDMSFANIFCWRHFHRSEWAEVEGFLVIRFLIDGKGQVGYMQPIGEGDFYPILALLAEDARTHFGQPLRLYGLCREGRKYITDVKEHSFAFHDDRALSDYIYLAEDLRTLAGRKYQPKRNHLNRFTHNYPYRFEPLAPSHFADCLYLVHRWQASHRSEEQDEAMIHEERALQEAFTHWEALDLQGGALYVQEELVAFTYGSAINYNTFDCHIEKADTRYEGVFAAINKLFIESLPSQFIYINREEDLGLEGLRRAKLSYYPTLLWPKTSALQLGPEERACKLLWQEVFGDDEAFIDHFLICHHQPQQLFTHWEKEELVAMLHLIPFQHEGKRVGYLYGIATAPRARHQGLATRLIQQAIEKAKEEQFSALILIPANEGLRSFYSRFGFKGEIPIHFEGVGDFDFGSGDPLSDHAMVLPLSTATSDFFPLELHLKK